MEKDGNVVLMETTTKGHSMTTTTKTIDELEEGEIFELRHKEFEFLNVRQHVLNSMEIAVLDTDDGELTTLFVKATDAVTLFSSVQR